MAPHIPVMIPRIIRRCHLLAGKAFSTVIANNGAKPNRLDVMKLAQIHAVNEVSRVSVENFLCISSMENASPARGALRIAAKPAPDPAHMKRAVCFFRLLESVDKPFAAIAPN